MDEAIDQFLTHLKYEQKASPCTLRAYGEDLAAIATMLEDDGVEAWESASHADLRRVLVTLQSKGLAPASVNRRLAAVRSFYRYLVRCG
ncbi:MAG: site-specific integrase, partial [Chloroflexi bacterium]|nr:site-specific integrase [Chloroflexota bacterium]